MKKRITISHTTANSLVVAVVFVFTAFSCINNTTNVIPNEKNNLANTFNFSTTQDIQLNVKYDVPKGYQVLFEVYTENPFKIDADGQIIKRVDIQPKITRVTDENGLFNGKEVLPAYLGSDLYIYTSYIGVPSLYKATVTANTVNAIINWDTMTDPATLLRPSTNAILSKAYQIPSDLLTLGDWSVTGRPNYLDSEGSLTLSATLLSTINKTIPESGTCSTIYRQAADFEVYDAQNRAVEVKVRFVGGTSSAASTFGYYCYPIGATKAQIANAKKYIIFPNTKTGVGIKGGECVQLHYIDANGVDRGTAFPNGIKIGWFIRNDAFRSGNIGNGYATFCSTTNQNSDNRTHTAAFKLNDFVVLSFEDWYDNDYNDVQFNVWSNPIEAIVTPNIPDVTPTNPNNDLLVAYKMTYNGILAFEDNWPSKGDYDLNDVVVKYNSILNFNYKNKVLSTEDTFTAMWSGALYKNGFGYQLNTERTNVECVFSQASEFVGHGLDPNLSLATISLFTNALDVTANNTRTPAIKVTTKFKIPVDHETLGSAPYNPFIYVFQDTGYNRKEVHLVNYKPTDKANMSLFGTNEDMSNPSKNLYYTSSSDFPFAINLSDAVTMTSKEKEAINKTYPKYSSWASSHGNKDKDWYIK